jgi:hypothetical protein
MVEVEKCRFKAQLNRNRCKLCKLVVYFAKNLLVYEGKRFLFFMIIGQSIIFDWNQPRVMDYWI